jgi:predicted TIM-barrel fold metal-dependent hydrolase
LRVAFLEANCSWLPWLLWRLDEAWELDGDVFAPDLQQKPSDYFKRQCRVSIEPDEVIASNVIEQVGSDYLVFSTDYPHVDSRYPEAVNYFLRLPLRDEHKRKILWDNCMSYYAMAA